MLGETPSDIANRSTTPSPRQRLDERTRPVGRPVMYQRWSRLLFLHWVVDPKLIQARLPRGLTVDIWEERAYLGIVPFSMQRIRPRGFPPLPGISDFLEINVRTYVHDSAGRPGVWFFSLDCNQPLAVWTARMLFHLPYEHARMRANRSAAGCIEFRTKRRGAHHESRFQYDAGPLESVAVPGTLEFFLTERYTLFSMDRGGGLFAGRVHHPPYPLASAEVGGWDADLAISQGLLALDDRFVHAVASRGVEVEVFGLERLSE